MPSLGRMFFEHKVCYCFAGLYLYNNTISDHEVQTNVSLSEIKDFLLAKGMSNYEAESEINV